jgi:hypothetical protein
MTMLRVLETSRAAFQDDDIGIAVQVAKLAAAGAPEIRADFDFGKWSVRPRLNVAYAHAVVLRPGSGADETKVRQQGYRDSTQQIEIAVETFHADLDALQDAIAVLQAGVLLVLDELVDFSVARKDTVYEIVGPVVTRYGEFAGTTASGTSAGFVTQVTLNERSAQ